MLCCVADAGDAGEIESGVQRQTFDFVAEMEMAVHVYQRWLRADYTVAICFEAALCNRPQVAYNAGVEKLDHLLLGSCSFTAAGLGEELLSAGTEENRLPRLLRRAVQSVEVDATFYRIPSEKTVRRWYEQTPENFVFACKVRSRSRMNPAWSIATSSFASSCQVMSGLRHKLGPMLFQFPYFNRKALSG